MWQRAGADPAAFTETEAAGPTARTNPAARQPVADPREAGRRARHRGHSWPPGRRAPPRTPGSRPAGSPREACTEGFRATVSGKMIERVVFSLDGKRSAAGPARRSRCRAGRARQPQGEARITFKDSTRAKTVTLAYGPAPPLCSAAPGTVDVHRMTRVARSATPPASAGGPRGWRWRSSRLSPVPSAPLAAQAAAATPRASRSWC